jgi:hypothetical protein
MNLGKIVQNEDRRLIRQAAIAAGLVAGLTTLNGVLGMLADGGAVAWLTLAIGVISLALAFGISRGSRVASVAVLVLFLLGRLISFVLIGPVAILNLWTVILAVVLFAGMRATFADYERERSSRARTGPVADA